MDIMNRYFVLLLLLLAIIIVEPASAAWSVADPNDPANAELIAWAEKQGYWNFPYDENAPWVTAGMYCCWWERWYNNMRTGRSTTVTSETFDDMSSRLTADKSVETEAYCPSCCDSCEDNTPGLSSDFMSRSAVLLAEKPWLDGYNSDATEFDESEIETKIEEQEQNKPSDIVPTVTNAIASLTFGEAS